MHEGFATGITSLRLSDFGTARQYLDLSSRLRATYEYAPGDYSYVSPEMLVNLHNLVPEIAFIADVYSLGVILYEMFSGYPLVMHQIFPSFAKELRLGTQKMKLVKDYDKVIESLAPKYVLPSVTDNHANVSDCIHGPIDALYKEMVTLDYRLRLSDFPLILRRIDECLALL